MFLLFNQSYYLTFQVIIPFFVRFFEKATENLLFFERKGHGKGAEAYLEPCQTSKMECFPKIVNGF